MVIEESILINADVKKVWDTFVNFSCWNKWCTAVTGVSAPACPMPEPGSVVRFCMRPFSIPLTISPSIDEVVEFQKVVWSGRKLGVHATHEFSFIKQDGGTEVVSREVFGGMTVKLFSFLIPFKRLHKTTVRLLEELKREAERIKDG